MKFDPIQKARLEGLRRGIELAADFADDYNSLSLHDYRLGDCIRAKYSLRRGTPRRNTEIQKLLASCKGKVLRSPVGKSQILQLAQVLETEGWAKYSKNRRSVAAEVAESVEESIRLARRLLNAGYRDCTPYRETPLKIIEYKEAKKQNVKSVSPRKRRRT